MVFCNAIIQKRITVGIVPECIGNLCSVIKSMGFQIIVLKRSNLKESIRGLMVAEVGFNFRDRRSNDEGDGLRQVIFLD